MTWFSALDATARDDTSVLAVQDQTAKFLTVTVCFRLAYQKILSYSFGDLIKSIREEILNFITITIYRSLLKWYLPGVR